MRWLLLVAVLSSPFAADWPPAGAVGGPAPPLHVERWLRGEPLPRFEPGTVYVLDFWATWCMPCISLMPHISELQERFASRGVRFVGLTGPDTAGSTLDGVERFLEQKGEAIRFAVAWDGLAEDRAAYLDVLQGRTMTAYLKGAEADGIPFATVVDGAGRVAWVGQPAAVEPVLEAILAGRWDMAAAVARHRAQKEADPKVLELRSLAEQRRFPEANALARTLAEGPCSDDPGALRLIAMILATATPPGTVRDLDVALEIALRADTLSSHADVAVLPILARIRFLRGELREAIAAQEQAVAISEPPLRDTLLQALERYRESARVSP